MRMSATAEQLEYLAELGVSVFTTPPAKPAAPVAAPASAAIACPSVAAQQPVFVPVAVPVPEPKSWWGQNSWWIGLLASTAVVLLKLIVFLVMKGCNP